MSYHKYIGIMGMVWAATVGLAHSAVVVVDDFNSYVLTSGTTNYLQAQNPQWARSGLATTDGISIIAGGVGGTKGASYSVAWTSSATTGTVRYTFSATQNLSTLTDVTLDLNVSTLVAGTTVALQLRSGSTIFQTTAPLSLTNTTFSNFDFSTASSSLTRIQGSANYATMLGAVDTIAFIYGNTGGTGSQAIRFDNFDLVTSVPEPGTTALLGLSGALVLWQIRRRRRPAQPVQPALLP